MEKNYQVTSVIVYGVVTAILVVFIAFIIISEKKKNGNCKTKLLKFFKYIGISIICCYAYFNLVNFNESYSGYMSLNDYCDGMSEEEFEAYLKDVEEGLYYNNVECWSKEIIGGLKLVKYTNEHPEILSLSDEVVGEESVRVINYKFENEISMDEIVEKFKSGDEKITKDLYNQSKCTKVQFTELLECMQLNEDNMSLATINRYKEIVENNNIDIDQEIERIKNKERDAIKRYFDEDLIYYEMNYPYAMDYHLNYLQELGTKKTDFIYGIILGIFIGIIVYTYSQTNKMKVLVGLAVIEVTFMMTMEKKFLDDLGWVSLKRIKYNGTSVASGYFSATAILVATILCVLAVKIISNFIKIKKLNKML